MKTGYGAKNSKWKRLRVKYLRKSDHERFMEMEIYSNASETQVITIESIVL